MKVRIIVIKFSEELWVRKVNIGDGNLFDLLLKAFLSEKSSQDGNLLELHVIASQSTSFIAKNVSYLS